MREELVMWPDGTGKVIKIIKTLIKDGKIWPESAAWKPIGDGITRCIYCGKKLTDELSFARGVGPECIKKYGPWPERAWIEPHVKSFNKFNRKLAKENKAPFRMVQWMELVGIEIPKNMSRKLYD